MSCSCDNNPLILPVGATGATGPKGDPGFGFEHFIGEEFDGGVVFHVYRDSLGVEHGLICSIVDQSNSSPYSDIDTTSIGASTTWNGNTNTNLMSIQLGVSLGAWLDCSDYSYDGFTDWYLPSIDELSLLSTNRFNVNKTLSTIGAATQVVNDGYWSSTEYNSTEAIFFGFYTQQVSNLGKYYTLNVRAIRQF
jgi:hypothetical protein